MWCKIGILIWNLNLSFSQFHLLYIYMSCLYRCQFGCLSRVFFFFWCAYSLAPFSLKSWVRPYICVCVVLAN